MAVAVVLKVIGVLAGSALFAVGVAGENGAMVVGGVVLLVLSLLLGPSSGEPSYHQ
jgi:hypothetical protein